MSRRSLIGIDELVADIKAGAKPVIYSTCARKEEFDEVHILGAHIRAAVRNLKTYLKSIPRDRPVVLY